MSYECRSCSGTRILPSVRVFARAFLGGPVILTGIAKSEVSASVCVECGHIELKATELASLRAAYAAHDPLDLKI